MSKPDLSSPGGLQRAIGYPGMVVAGEVHAIRDFVNDAAIPVDFGVAVAFGSADGNCKAPSALTDKLLGISVRHVTMPATYGGGNTVRYPQYKAVPVLQEGPIHATAAQAVNRGDRVGALLNGAATTAAKPGGNTGNGTLTLDATTPTLSGYQVGTYTVRCTATASNGGTFTVTGPDGASKGTVAVGSTFNNEIKFVVADGSTDFALGDGFDVVVAGGLLGSVEPAAMPSSSAAKSGGNTGTGTLTLDGTTPLLAGARPGVYTVRFTAAAANNGTFRVYDPDGAVLGDVVMSGGAGSFANQVKFALADGGTDFSVGDGFDIAVGGDRIAFPNAYWETTTAKGALGIVKVVR